MLLAPKLFMMETLLYFTANAQIFSSATALAFNSINAEFYRLQSKDATACPDTSGVSASYICAFAVEIKHGSVL